MGPSQTNGKAHIRKLGIVDNPCWIEWVNTSQNSHIGSGSFWEYCNLEESAVFSKIIIFLPL
jgi:hypothetical protein